jgi:Flp pilus assembly protein CpaB
MCTQTTVVIFAILAAFGLVAIVAVDIALITQEVEAKGCKNSNAANASQGRCVNPGPG